MNIKYINPYTPFATTSDYALTGTCFRWTAIAITQSQTSVRRRCHYYAATATAAAIVPGTE